MRHPSRRAVAALLVGVLAAGGLAAGAWWWLSGQQSRLEAAVAMAPSGTERLTWTDWQAVRRDLGVEPDDSPSARELQDLLDAAFAQDLSTMSALVSSAQTLNEAYGLSPATISWELLAQGPDGAVVTLGMAEDEDLDRLGDRLEELGYSRPDDEDGVWEGGPELLPRIGPGLTPELQHVALDAEAGVVRVSDSAGHLARVVDEDAGGLGEDVAAVVDSLGAERTPLAAAVMTGDHACRALSMTGADEGDEEHGASLVTEAGGVDPLTAFAMGSYDDTTLRAAMSFATEDQAVVNAEARARLATGEAPGQGGSFSDRFAVSSARARGGLVVLDLEPEPGAYVLSDLTSGPVLFATC